MTYKTYTTNRTYSAGLIPKHGGYRKLLSYQTAEIIYDGTVVFCGRWISPIGDSNKTDRTYRSFKLQEQMTGAARSGKQNITEGCQVSGTSKKTELKLINVARGSLEELLQDYEDFLRQRGLPLWPKNHPKAEEIRKLAYRENRSYETYVTYIEGGDAEEAANTLICLIHQANYLLDQQLRTLEKEFLEEGGFTERLYQKRIAYRKREEYNGTNDDERTTE